MIYALETKAASVAKRKSTAMFVRNDIRSKYTGFLSKSVYYAVKYVRTMIILLDIYFGNMHVQDPLQFVCVTKLVCLCVHIICVYRTCLYVCVCVCVYVCVHYAAKYHRYYEESC